MGAHRTRAGLVSAGHRRWCTPCVFLGASRAHSGSQRHRCSSWRRPPAAATPSRDSGTDNGDGGSADKGSVVVGGQDFTESQVLAAIYAKVLENEGYSVETKLVTTRDVYLPELSSGNVDIVPDYLAGITDYLNTEKNGPDAPPGVEQRPRRDAGSARAARRGAGHLDPAAVGRDRPERVLRDPGVRRREQPGDPVRLRCARASRSSSAPRRTARGAPTARAG